MTTREQVEMPVTRFQIESGRPHPLGAVPDAQGVNFSVYSDRATAVELLLFDGLQLEPIQTIKLDTIKNRTFHFWHVYVRGLKPGFHYAYRVAGPDDLHGRGDRYDHTKVLIDPYARGNTDALWDRTAACSLDDNLATSMRSVIIEPSDYDWEGDTPLKRPMSETIIYEMHVRGFTRSETSGVEHRGTFAGIIEKIPYLQSLGITAVELMPIFDFDEKDLKHKSPDGKPLKNYWGYDPIGFFAPQSFYCVSPESGNHLHEFRDLVKALHKAEIEVILDVVFNHTNEGDELGPMISFKGFANGVYYMLSPKDRQHYLDYSGCGNTFNGNHPIAQKLIVDTLEYWVTETHVDGFRFDEAVILCRDVNGYPMLYPPVIWQIELSDILADTKVIAEAWDAAGLYEVGYFPGFRWGEWNGRYRDVIRSFVRGDKGSYDGKTLIGRVADVMAGSSDIFEANGEQPINSVNFVTAHDGFTLNDLVSYNVKHNEANGEDNRDGSDYNLSWNYGVEGATDDPAIEALRARQVKNFATILLLSQGVPMFVSGDEVRRTQQGNNNAYCQDNEVSWFDWTLVEKQQGLLRFFQRLIALRKQHPALRRARFFTGELNRRGMPDITWHGCKLNTPDWLNPDLHVLAFTLGGFAEGQGSEAADFHVMLNMDVEDLDFDVPQFDERKWYKILDTALNAPADFAENVEDPAALQLMTEITCRVQNRSIQVLISH